MKRNYFKKIFGSSKNVIAYPGKSVEEKIIKFVENNKDLSTSDPIDLERIALKFGNDYENVDKDYLVKNLEFND